MCATVWVRGAAWAAALLILPALVAPEASADSQASRRPNVLFIFPDQWRAQALSCMGNRQVRTPNLDRLASQGILFRHTFANSPVCCPARATMLTGKYPHKHGVIINDLRLREEEGTIAELLRAGGYMTGFIGKWHLDGGIRLPGFVPPGERRQGFAWWAANECSHRHFKSWFFRDKPDTIPINRFEPEIWADEAIGFMTRFKDQQWFLMVAMGPPHNPYKAPPEYMRHYDPKRIMTRPNWVPGTRLGSKANIAAYYAAVQAVDHAIGRMLKNLDELGLSEDTIVFVTSDHGDMLGSQGTFLKRKPWEESIRVPGILRYPRRIEPRQVKSTLISHVDMAPTLLALCGAPIPIGMQGTNLAPVILGESNSGPEAVYFQILMPYPQSDLRPWRGVRTERYMYARWRDQPWVLYDLEEDPYELHNLAGRPEYEELEARMDKLLGAYMAETGDSWDNDLSETYILHHDRAVYSVEDYVRMKGGKDKAVFRP